MRSRLDSTNGERVHVFGRAEVWPAEGRAAPPGALDRAFGLGAHLAALERLKQKLAAEGLFARRAKAAAAATPAPDRARHGERRSGQARRDRVGHGPVPARAAARGRDARPGATRSVRRRGAASLATSRRSTSSCSPAAEGASKTCFRSATSVSCGPSSTARCRSYPQSATSRTRRFAIWPPTPARRRPPRQPASSSPISRSSTATLERRREALRRGGRAASTGSASGWSVTTERLRRGGRLLLERRRTALEHSRGDCARCRRGNPHPRLRHRPRGDAVVRSRDRLDDDDRRRRRARRGPFRGRVEEVRA